MAVDEPAGGTDCYIKTGVSSPRGLAWKSRNWRVHTYRNDIQNATILNRSFQNIRNFQDCTLNV